MALIGNILWFVFGGGWLLGLLWLLSGCLWCITVIGIPIGVACFRISNFAFFPFGKELVPADMLGEKIIPGTTIMNILWCIISGFWLSLFNIIAGIACFTSIIGIPFGLAHFKLAIVSFAPLGQRIVSSEIAAAVKMQHAQRVVAMAQGQPYCQPQPQQQYYQQPQQQYYQQPQQQYYPPNGNNQR